MTGPPWTHSTSGAGESAEAPSGSTSQERTVLPSATTVEISVRVPGTEAMAPGARSRSGSWSAPVVANRTGCGGWSTELRSAYSALPSRLTTTSL